MNDKKNPLNTKSSDEYFNEKKNTNDQIFGSQGRSAAPRQTIKQRKQDETKTQEKLKAEIKTQVKEAFDEEKSTFRKNKPLLIIVIVVAFGIFFGYSDIRWMVGAFFYDRAQAKELKHLEIVPNYKYDFKDTGLGVESDPFEALLGQGEDLTIDASDERFIKKEESDGYMTYDMSLIVGRDIVPGIYTIRAYDDMNISIDNEIKTYIHVDNDFPSYNIPLANGDQIDLGYSRYADDDEKDKLNSKVTFTMQDQVVDYEAGKNGVYVYGLSNNNEQIELEKDGYQSATFCYPNKEDNRPNCEVFYNQKITLRGTPGSYFSIEFPD